MKKIIIIAGVVLIVILIVLWILLSALNRKIQTNENGGTITTLPKTGTYASKKKSLAPAQSNFLEQLKNNPVETTDFKISYSPALDQFVIEKKTAAADAALQTWAQNNGIGGLINDPSIFSSGSSSSNGSFKGSGAGSGSGTTNPAIAGLPASQQQNLIKIQSQLPIEAKDYSIGYSQIADTYIIHPKTNDAPQALNQWAQQNNITGVITNPDIFKVTNQSIQEYKNKIENLALPPLPTPTSTTNEPFNIVKDMIKLVGTVATPTPSQGVQPPSQATPAQNPPPDVSDVNALISSYGLPSPRSDGNQGYLALRNQLNSKSQSQWATRALLNAEKNVKSKGFDVKRYLTTAWIWFETGSPLWPDPYELNCNDRRSASAVNLICGSNNMQIAGYQAASRRNDYVTVFQKLYNSSQLTSILQSALSNSNNAVTSSWNYQDSSQQKGLVTEFSGSIVQSSMSDIAPSTDFFDRKGQFMTLLLGKDPGMVIALNTYAVSDGDLINTLKQSGCGYGYICASQKQLLSNMIAALYLFDTGGDSLNQNSQTPPSESPPANTSIVSQIVSSVQNNCSNATVTANNAGCLNNVTLLTNSARNILQNSANSFFYLQCVGWVKAMIMQTTGTMTLQQGDAKYQLHDQGGYHAIANNPQNRRRIKPGDIPIWTGGAYGHIAYVVEVIDNDRGIVQVAEANIVPGKVDLRPIDLNNINIGGWLSK